MSEIKVNKISPKQTCTQLTLGDSGDTIIVTSGANFNTDAIKNLNTSSIITQTNATTITLGYSGSTIAIASGASQTGFGRTGTVNWDTTAKTANFTAVSGVGYFVDTTTTTLTVNLPAGVAGDIVAVSDYADTAATNNITITPNGTNKINGINGSYLFNTNGASITFFYVDATRGWKDINDATLSVIGINPFVAATGGTITTCGDYKIHSFTGPGTFTVTNAGNPSGSTKVDYLVVAGGGAGGCNHAGGGGAGGFRESVPSPAAWTASPLANPGGALPVSVQGYPITVGAGGASSNNPGNSSIFSTITSAGGGRGANDCNPAANGGSGGGGHRCRTSGGSGNTPPVAPPQGNNGGNAGGSSGNISGGGGGGATASGTASGPSGSPGGAGGTGATSSINGTPTGRAGGGGGGAYSGTGGTASQGGGAGGDSPGIAGSPGTTNTGGGGGGGSTSSAAGGSGGSGIVIIRYKYQ